MKKELQKIYNYLVEYEKLCNKYGWNIWGCGCCESPLLSNYWDKENNFRVEEIKYDGKKIYFSFVDKTEYIKEYYGYKTIEKMDLKQLKEYIDNFKE